jgi:GNAT superfamily N-acetyltransferase
MLRPFDPNDLTQRNAITTIWNAACGPNLTIPDRCVEYNTRNAPGGAQAGRLVIQDGEPVGFVLASALPDDPATSPPDLGWIDALAVLPAYQSTGLGSALLGWAEQWLIEQKCGRAQLGGSLRPFVAGLPVELRTEAFFRKRGYRDATSSGTAWDVARDLHDYASPRTVRPIDGIVRPARPGDDSALLSFLRRAFPDRWRFEYQEYLREGGRISDYMILETARGIEGFCRLAFVDSIQPPARYYPQPLPQPWGQLGTIGVASDRRGHGYGAAVLDAGLRRLRDNGVRGCVIDWTELLDFYGKFGFKPYRQYAMLIKELT